MAATTNQMLEEEDFERDFDNAERQFRNQYDIMGVIEQDSRRPGRVFRARCRHSGEFRALRHLKLHQHLQEGVPYSTLREIAILKELSHDNVVRLFDVFYKPGMLYLVLELCDYHLRKHMRACDGNMHATQVKDFAWQLLEGIKFCHANRIIHRDLMPQNLLIDSKLRLKIAGFHLARVFTLRVPQYSHEVVTLWYRPPEILLGSKLYSIPVDIWSIGCILAEMATGSALFAGDSEIDTAFKIFQKLGTPTEAMWPGLSELRDFKATFPTWQPKGWANIRNTQAQLGATGIELLDRLMAYNPGARISARGALQHAYFA